ncbi:hypothetical protein LX32DRAFT_602148 [Colletotrichum zoysiae]|uniref:Rta1 domain-containing protein n=1 Tax=Colletotrichum zoysiae TaxID=1216348 RepID=A0AAD9H5U8_9PEZI|nr:hypothetical protein LX32DRAFT_602148 [Colletotrichum zoysiae]
MNAEQFRAGVENGDVPVDRHDRVLRIAFIYLDEGLWNGNGVFDVVDQLHSRGWSFGEGVLRFNRTLDVFYLAQLAASIYRSSDQLNGDFPSPDDFATFYDQHSHLLKLDAWREYYSQAFLAQPTSARFYRLPDLRDLPDSSDPLGQPRRCKGTGHFTKLLRWAHNVARTRRRQPMLPAATMTKIALSTLRQTTKRLQRDHPGVVRPYSETQARFWLRYMDTDVLCPATSGVWGPNGFGVHVAQGALDVWAWEAYYTREQWDAAKDAAAPLLEPDLDGTRKSEVEWCGLPDGGVGSYARCRGWEPELGSEEEVAFLAAVAARETEGVDASSDNLDYATRSHVLLGVLLAAFETTERGRRVEHLGRRVAEAGRLDESEAERWLRHALAVMEPCAREWHQYGRKPFVAEDRSELLRRILVKNGQLFARWMLSPTSKEYGFELDPRK